MTTARPPTPWRAPALTEKLSEAVDQLHGGGGMGFYAAEGYRLAAKGDERDPNDPVGERKRHEAALKSYLRYVLRPARGDSYRFASAVLGKINGRPTS